MTGVGWSASCLGSGARWVEGHLPRLIRRDVAELILRNTQPTLAAVTPPCSLQPMRLLSLSFILGVLLAAAPLPAQRGGHSGRSYSGHSHSSASPRAQAVPRAPSYHAPKARSSPPHVPGVSAPRARATHPRTPSLSTPGARDRRGRIKRSEDAKRAFERQTGHPHGWAGHVVDHVKPLACGGADAPSNMQWQTVEAGKAKDRVERQGCGRR